MAFLRVYSLSDTATNASKSNQTPGDFPVVFSCPKWVPLPVIHPITHQVPNSREKMRQPRSHLCDTTICANVGSTACTKGNRKSPFWIPCILQMEGTQHFLTKKKKRSNSNYLQNFLGWNSPKPFQQYLHRMTCIRCYIIFTIQMLDILSV